MASLLAARRQHFAAALGLHANAEAVRLGAPPASRLKCALWQNNPPLLPAMVVRNRRAVSFTRNSRTAHYLLHRLIPNLVVYSTLAHRVKKCARLSGAPGWRHPGFRSCQLGFVRVQNLADLGRERNGGERLLQKLELPVEPMAVG